jgi:plasmid stability protein
MEAEIRAILTQASLSDESRDSAEALQNFVDGLYGGEKPSGVVDEMIGERRREALTE